MYLPDRAKFLAKLIYQKYQEKLIETEVSINLPMNGSRRIILIGANDFTEELELNRAQYQHENSFEIEESLEGPEKRGLLNIDRSSRFTPNWNISINSGRFL